MLAPSLSDRRLAVSCMSWLMPLETHRFSISYVLRNIFGNVLMIMTLCSEPQKKVVSGLV